MNDTSAREATLLQAFETAHPASPSWSDDDRRWASRVALQETPAAADDAAFIARRARHAMQRLMPREPAAAAWLGRRLWRARWVAWAMAGAIVAGLLADAIGSSQRINLLAPPLWGVIAWNLVVYLLLLGHALAALLRRGRAAPGAINRIAQRVLQIGRRVPEGSGAWPRFASLWSQRSALLAGARAASVLHAAAAALALGLIAGLYARGLVLDYRAAWESTFLSPAAAHAVLSALLAPASALSGIALPDSAGFEALRVAHGESVSGVPAAPWIHLCALTLLLFVVLPRCALALASALRASRLARDVELPLADAYFQSLLREQRGEAARIVVLPYAQTPGPQAVLGLRALFAAAFGDGVQLQVLPTLAFGAEDEASAWPALPADTTHAVALFDLAATPEAEQHGVLIQQLAQRAPAGAAVLALIDEAAFAARFRGDAARLDARRAAWRQLLERAGQRAVFADLQASDPAAVQRSLQAALAAGPRVSP